MLVKWSNTMPDAPGMYFLKLPNRQPLYVFVGKTGIVVHAHSRLIVEMSRQQFDAAQWSEAVTFAPWRTGHSS